MAGFEPGDFVKVPFPYRKPALARRRARHNVREGRVAGAVGGPHGKIATIESHDAQALGRLVPATFGEVQKRLTVGLNLRGASGKDPTL